MCTFSDNDHDHSREEVAKTMQIFGDIHKESVERRSLFYTTTLLKLLPEIPANSKWKHVWPVLKSEMNEHGAMNAALLASMWLVQNSTPEECVELILPTFRNIVSNTSNMSAIAIIIRNLPLLKVKSTPDAFTSTLVPILYKGLESKDKEVQLASIISTNILTEELSEWDLLGVIIPKLTNLFTNDPNELQFLINTLLIFEKILPKSDTEFLVRIILPSMLTMRVNESDIVSKYCDVLMAVLNDTKFILHPHLIATMIIPTLMPATVDANLTFENFSKLIQVLYALLDRLEKDQQKCLQTDKQHAKTKTSVGFFKKPVLKLENPPPFFIPTHLGAQIEIVNADEVDRPSCSTTTSSIKNVSVKVLKGLTKFIDGRKGSKWTKNATASTSAESHSFASDNKYLRVENVLPSRHQSETSVLKPRTPLAASSYSSVGGSSGRTASGPSSSRNSSINNQECRTSKTNLLPRQGGTRTNRNRSFPQMVTSTLRSLRETSFFQTLSNFVTKTVTR